MQIFTVLACFQAQAAIAAAEAITPGFNSPTVSALEDPAWCAVRAMVRRKEIIDIMERLESLGGRIGKLLPQMRSPAVSFSL